jgi:hypothetical protein
MDEVEIRARCPRRETSNLVVIGTTAPNKVSCCQCGSVLLDYEPVRGYVYVLSNDHMPGLVKVGFTARDFTKRVAELNSGTAVPAPFVIEGVFPSDDPEGHEQQVYRLLAATRLSNKEFFRTEVRDALRAVALVFGGPPKYVREPALVVEPEPGSPEQPKGTPGRDKETKRLRNWQERMYRR